MIRITGDSINSVPKIQSDVISEQHWGQLNKEHKNLLRLAQNKPLGTECARVFGLNMEKLGKDYVGKPGENRVLVPEFDIPHIIIHNHADGATISLQDFESFLRRPQTYSIQAISNGGFVYILEKLVEFDAVEAIKKYISAVDEVIDLVDDGKQQSDIERAIERFLQSLTENGFTYGRWIR